MELGSTFLSTDPPYYFIRVEKIGTWENHMVLPETFSLKNLGNHAFVLYDSHETFREFYCGYTKEMLKQNRIVLVFPYFETKTNVLHYLEEYEVDVAKYRQDDTLIILDAYENFFGTNQDFGHYLALAAKHAKKVNKDGIAAIIDISVFDHESLTSFKHSKDALAAYEDEMKVILKGLDSDGLDAQIVCCYHKGNYEAKMTQFEKRKLSMAHVSSFELKSNGRISIKTLGVT